MPEWVTITGGIAAFILAIGVIWSRVIKPGVSLVYLMGKLLPLVEELVENFQADPDRFGTLAEIAKEFKANDGKSLRDVINKLERGIEEINGKLERIDGR